MQAKRTIFAQKNVKNNLNSGQNKAVTDGPSTLGKTSEMLDEAFRAHVKLKHSEDFNLAAIPSHRTAPGLSMAIGKNKRPRDLN
jgi:hypothetical protein